MSAIDLSVIIPYRHAEGNGLLRGVWSAIDLGAEVCVWLDHTEDESIRKLENGLAMWKFDIPYGTKVGYGRRGKIGAMNGALGMATCNYVFYCGDDDFIGAGVVALVNYLKANPSVAFAYGDQQFMGARTDLVRNRQYHDGELYRYNLPLNAIVYRRDVVMALGGYRDILGDPMRGDQPEDYDLLLRVIEAGHHGVYVATDAPVHHYTLAQNRMWALMQQNADKVYQAFVAHHPKYTGGQL